MVHRHSPEAFVPKSILLRHSLLELLHSFLLLAIAEERTRAREQVVPSTRLRRLNELPDDVAFDLQEILEIWKRVPVRF